MTTAAMLIKTVMAQSEAARSALAEDPVVRQYVRRDVPMPMPYVGKGEIRLFIIGQDPTVNDKDTLLTIDTVLNLNRRGPLLVFVSGLCRQLGVTLDNIYATNACKNHFTRPPTKIKETDGCNVLESSAMVWLPVLQREIAHFPSAVVISLGEPVLSMLVRPEYAREMRLYWGYDRSWQAGHTKPMRWIAPEECTLGVRVFPFVHQPTIRGGRTAFYRAKRDEYLAFIRRSSGLESE